MQVMLPSLIRYALALGMGWLVAKGIITQTDSTTYLPTLANFLTLLASGAGLFIWSYISKLNNGWLDKK